MRIDTDSQKCYTLLEPISVVSGQKICTRPCKQRGMAKSELGKPDNTLPDEPAGFRRGPLQGGPCSSQLCQAWTPTANCKRKKVSRWSAPRLPNQPTRRGQLRKKRRYKQSAVNASMLLSGAIFAELAGTTRPNNQFQN